MNKKYHAKIIFNPVNKKYTGTCFEIWEGMYIPLFGGNDYTLEGIKFWLHGHGVPYRNMSIV